MMNDSETIISYDGELLYLFEKQYDSFIFRLQIANKSGLISVTSNEILLFWARLRGGRWIERRS